MRVFLYYCLLFIGMLGCTNEGQERVALNNMLNSDNKTYIADEDVMELISDDIKFNSFELLVFVSTRGCDPIHDEIMPDIKRLYNDYNENINILNYHLYNEYLENMKHIEYDKPFVEIREEEKKIRFPIGSPLLILHRKSNAIAWYMSNPEDNDDKIKREKFFDLVELTIENQ